MRLLRHARNDISICIFAFTCIIHNYSMKKDTQVSKLIQKEEKRQKSVINLIASENYVSRGVLDALGSVFTNKYAEGYSGKRYYGGNAVVDEVENLARERALQLFKLSQKKWSVNPSLFFCRADGVGIIESMETQRKKCRGEGPRLNKTRKVSRVNQN